jgi:hypothetical protein
VQAGFSVELLPRESLVVRECSTARRAFIRSAIAKSVRLPTPYDRTGRVFDDARGVQVVGQDVVVRAAGQGQDGHVADVDRLDYRRSGARGAIFTQQRYTILGVCVVANTCRGDLCDSLAKSVVAVLRGATRARGSGQLCPASL